MCCLRKYLPLFIISTWAFMACSEKPSTTQLPDQLADLHLARMEKDEVAKSKLSRMHHGVDFAEYESVIGTYREGENAATVYLTIFDDDEKSAQMMSRMVKNLKAQKSSEFSYTKEFEREGKVIHSAAGAGESHYFFRDGRKNIWISAPPMLGEMVLNDFLARSK
ncbi:hypothetical protein GWO43_24465 [candidate division KSB1 bacterium]|nr:hypothetical protein [candidate division KSB1 bacterium]NIR69052.1 hypothetical protein [candidate division KSB1 bacterium]NIS25620.1 hypothetical protein [candidate division KSB1 bacterium]NIT73970.1 hypothetical protein [candidate division KSB1 bacterium]NIU26297.1 hypothetical protein [candidate division KSB1 bacterium]